MSEKKKYARLSNLLWALRLYLKNDKAVIISLLPSILITVALSLLDSYFPKLVLEKLEQKVPFVQILSAVIALLVLRFLFNTASTWLECRRVSNKYTPTNLLQFQI